MSTTELRTVRAVLAYAKQLRARAERERAEDPYAEPYSPSEWTARKVFQEALGRARRAEEKLAAGPEGSARNSEQLADLAAGEAISVLASRVVVREREHREETERSRRAERRHARRQRIDRAEREAALAGLSLGARLDKTLTALRMLSEAPTQVLTEDPLHPLPERSGPPSAPLPADRYSALLGDARHLVYRLETELSHAQRREIQEHHP